MDFNIAHAWLALLILVMVSLAQSPVLATILPMYTSFSVLLLVRIGLLLVIFTLDLCLFSSGFQSYSVSCGIKVLSYLLLDVLGSDG